MKKYMKYELCLLLVLILFFINCLTSNEDDNDNEILPEIVLESEFPDELDLRIDGIITTPKDQGSCGSCWAFAAVGMIEALYAKKTGNLVDLSEQQLVSCTPSPARGCDGAGVIEALKYIRDHGLVTEVEYPYNAEDGECLINGGTKYITSCEIEGFDNKSLLERVEMIKERIMQYGPVTSNMHFFRDFDAYRSGVYVTDPNSPELGGHNVMIIGWKNDKTVKNGGYWIGKNSFGPNWGEGGFFRIAYGECNLDNYYANYAVIAEDLK